MVSFYKFTVWSNLPQHTGRHLLPAWQSAGDLAFFMIIESSQSVLSVVYDNREFEECAFCCFN